MTSDLYFTATSWFSRKCLRKTLFKAKWGRGGGADSNRFLLSNSLFVLSSEPPNFLGGFGAKAPSAPSNDATDLVSESQVKTRFELVMEPVQTINQQTLILNQIVTF